MGLTEDETFKKYDTLCEHFDRKTLLPYEYEWTCFGCGYNVIKRKDELYKNQRKRINFINRLNYAEHRKFWICVDVYKLYDGIDFVKKNEVLSTLREKIQNKQPLNRKIQRYVRKSWFRTWLLFKNSNMYM